MRNTVCLSLLVIGFLVACAAACSATELPHAWVAGWGSGPGAFDYWYPDQGDDTAGLLSDTMDVTNQYYGRVAGSASMAGVVTLYSRVQPMDQVDAYAKILDYYRFYDQDNPGSTGAVPGLHCAITCSGDLSTDNGGPSFWVGTDEVYTKGSFQLSWNGSQHVLRTYIPHQGVDTSQVVGSSVHVSGVFPFDISANFGEDYRLNMMFKASEWTPYNATADSYINFLSTAVLSFYTTDPSISLGVTSTGAYSQGMVPEPGGLAALLSCVLGSAGMIFRRKR
ncbi:MAG: hypothetical protein NTU88_15305 [Armatimonadetes bacterium]|nr:hypothetical protein [Armatimonadota bacterium]